VPGGSIFCKCLVTQFISQLQSLPSRFGIPEGLVIEASGMANPKVMASMLHETRLDGQYRLARIISVIDPGSFHKLRQTLPNITAQIEASDLALINKADLYSDDEVQATADALRALNPGIKSTHASGARWKSSFSADHQRHPLQQRRPWPPAATRSMRP